MQTDDKQRWLVRANYHVLGPFTFQEVVDAIVAGEIHMMDEVADSVDRWRPIRDNPQFSAAIEQIRISSTGISDFTGTVRLENTQTITHTVEIDRTEVTGTVKINPDDDDEPEITAIVEPSIHNPYYSHKSQKSKNNTWYFVAGAAAFVIALVILTSFKKELKETARGSSFESNLQEGFKAKNLGRYQVALTHFRVALRNRPNYLDLVLEMGPLMVQYGNEIRNAKSLVMNALASRHESDFILKANTLLGIIYSYDGKLKEADSYYKKSLKIDNSFYIAKVNYGYNLMIQKKHSAALEQLRKAITLEKNNASAVVLLAINYINWAEHSGEKSYLKRALTLLKDRIPRSNDGKQEMLLLAAVAEGRLDKESSMAKVYVKELLQTDPLLTMDHYRDPLVDIRGTGWSGFTKYCQELGGALEAGTAKTLKGLCHLLSGQLLKAKAIFEQISNNGEEGAIAKALLSEVYMQMGDSEKSSATLEFSRKIAGGSLLPYYVSIRNCIKQSDTSCLKSMIGKLEKKDSLLLDNARTYYNDLSGNNSEKNKWLRRGLARSPTYIPLLRLEARYR